MNQPTSENTRKTRTLMIGDDVMGDKMAGPGIRYFHLCRVLGHHVDLTLAIVPQNRRSLAAVQAMLPDVTVVSYRRGEWDTLRETVEQSEVVILPPHTIGYHPQLVDYPGIVVIDGYNPLVPEYLAQSTTNDLDKQIREWSEYLGALYNHYLVADFIICASERQRFWWFGQLEITGRINPLTFQDDSSLRNLVDVVPYGMPQETPKHTKDMVKGVWPGIGQDDVVLLWGGGLWPWLDALTAVQAVHRLNESHPQLKLIFPGTVHPNLYTANAMPLRETKAYAYASEHKLLDSVVFFGEWVPYEDWPNILLESDIALSLHHDTIETQLAFRSRMLEYFWAGVPLIATTGDATGELVNRYDLGVVVDYQDVDGVMQAIVDIMSDSSAYQAGFAQARRDLTWEKAAEPLIRFCQNPRRAADRQAGLSLGIGHHDRKIREMEALVATYQSGRFMRIMRRVQDVRVRWQNWVNRV